MAHSRSKCLSRLINNRKGYAGIIATIFLVLVILFLFFNVYTFYNNRNTALSGHGGASRTDGSGSQHRTGKRINFERRGSRGKQHSLVTCRIANNGPLSAQLVRLWIKDVTTNQTVNTETSIVLQPGSIIPYFNSVQIANVTTSDQFTFWFITTRGNAISAYPDTNQFMK